MKRKHSKLKNPGVLFELLSRQVTSDMLQGKPPVALDLIRQYFTGDTELVREHTIYKAVTTAPVLSDRHAQSLLQALTEAYGKLNHKQLAKEKFALIRQINEHYNATAFFSARVRHYKLYASVFHLLEALTGTEFSDPARLAASRETILEHLTTQRPITEQSEEVSEFRQLRPSARKIVLKNMLASLRQRYGHLPARQQQILFEYLKGAGPTAQLAETLNQQIAYIRLQLKRHGQSVADEATRIKLAEVERRLQPVATGKVPTETQITLVLEHLELVDELSATADGNR